MEKLRPAIVSHQGFIALKKSIGAAEDFLADHPNVFLSAAVFASAMLDSYRVDLDAFDEELSETSLKHRILQGLIDEQQSPSKPVAIRREVTEVLLNPGIVKSEFREYSTTSEAASTFGERIKEAFAEFEDNGEDSDFGFLELPVAESEMENELHLALPLQDPLDQSEFSQASPRKWDRLVVSADLIEWREGSPTTEHAAIDIEWTSSHELIVQTHNLLRRGKGFVVKVRWKDKSGGLISEGISPQPLIPKPIRLQVTESDGPKPGDYLEITHQRFSAGQKAWECFVKVSFK